VYIVNERKQGEKNPDEQHQVPDHLYSLHSRPQEISLQPPAIAAFQNIVICIRKRFLTI
jgi:hypothetical protein